MIFILKSSFWLLLGLLFYTYIGYGLVLLGWIWLRKITSRSTTASSSGGATSYIPTVALVVPAYNERSCISAKWDNCLQLDYPADHLHLFFVTEGSSDGTTEWLEQKRNESGSTLLPAVTLLAGAERRGKVEAINQAMQHVAADVVVFTDANTHLNDQAIRRLVSHFQDEKVGAVAGEKRIEMLEKEAAAGAGEGVYWKYESALKRLDTRLHTVVGAAGELFAIRRSCFRPIEPDTLLDDFVMTLRIAQAGYRVVYEPEAYALERPSFSLQDEKKRKVRIAMGGFQAMSRLRSLWYPFTNPLLSFQYVSHRALRWAVAPFALVGVFALSSILAYQLGGAYSLIWYAQLAFYGLAALGYLLETRKLRSKLSFVPFYFTFMHWCVLLGYYRYATEGVSSGIWEKVTRSSEA
jgi:cellulose synthase/poly-beta-1,6-N-acetylglucosamine synthase-like glycosyltransferase